jgi:hypothetical protein
MKKNPFFKDAEPLSREQLKEIKGGIGGSCLDLGAECVRDPIRFCCPGLQCVFNDGPLIGTCEVVV